MRAIVFVFLVVCLVAAAPAADATARAQDQCVNDLVEEFKNTAPFYKQLDIGRNIIQIGRPAVLPLIESGLTHEDRHVRANVAYVSAGLDDPRGLQTLAAILRDRSQRFPRSGRSGWQLDYPRTD